MRPLARTAAAHRGPQSRAPSSTWCSAAATSGTAATTAARARRVRRGRTRGRWAMPRARAALRTRTRPPRVVRLRAASATLGTAALTAVSARLARPASTRRSAGARCARIAPSTPTPQRGAPRAAAVAATRLQRPGRRGMQGVRGRHLQGGGGRCAVRCVRRRQVPHHDRGDHRCCVRAVRRRPSLVAHVGSVFACKLWFLPSSVCWAQAEFREKLFLVNGGTEIR